MAGIGDRSADGDHVSNATPFCPTCGTALVLTRQGEFNPWVCPAGHGLAATLSEGYERAQEDELEQLWLLAKTASPGNRSCPMCEQPMVVVDLAWDSDEIREGDPGDGPDEGHEPLDVCVRDEVIWFDTGELDALPADLPDAEPTPEELAKVDEIAHTFGEQLDQAVDEREGHQLTERIYRRLNDHPGIVRFFGQKANKVNG